MCRGWEGRGHGDVLALRGAAGCRGGLVPSKMGRARQARYEGCCWRDVGPTAVMEVREVEVV